MLNLKVDTEKNGTQPVLNVAKNILIKSETLIILLVMVIILSILSPTFLHPQNLINVVRQISVIAIIAMGSTMAIITTGIDLSPGSVVALVGVVTATYAHSDSQLLLAILIGLFTGAFAGFINGSISALGKIPPFIATLGMYTAARGAALIFSDGRPVTDLSHGFEFIGGGYILGIPCPIYIMIVTGVLVHILLKHTKFGKHVYAIGGNTQAAVVSGINVERTLIYVYSLAGLLAGLGGIILTSRLDAGQPTSGVGYELDAIASAVIGGTSLSGGIGTIGGTMIGALIIGVLNNGLDLLNVSPYWQQILKGVIIVGAVLLDKIKNKK
ncbi:abc transporter permease [Lucifera butyrica]|uniref:Abc transporter permease n=1 Tax=Lucifera butyrica TaxID=1351585 RepID=A0A498R6Y3_9FIRM|nr:ABC transporter permease [Lucifera butyrica]VBB07254.1 abc transporter permease [Lucifera butyrica]